MVVVVVGVPLLFFLVPVFLIFAALIRAMILVLLWPLGVMVVVKALLLPMRLLEMVVVKALLLPMRLLEMVLIYMMVVVSSVEMKKMIGRVMEVNKMVVMVEFASRLGEEQRHPTILQCPSPQMDQLRGDNQSLLLFSFEAGVSPSAAFAFEANSTQ